MPAVAAVFGGISAGAAAVATAAISNSSCRRYCSLRLVGAVGAVAGAVGAGVATAIGASMPVVGGIASCYSQQVLQ